MEAPRSRGVFEARVEAMKNVPKRSSPGRLTQEDWIRIAVQGLLEHGSRGVRIAHMARELGVTPGSFYWHFRDRDAFRDEVLQFWLKEMISRAGAAAEAAGSGTSQLRALTQILVARGLPDYDTAMRTWAQDDPVVSRAVAKADKLRLRRVTRMLENAGFTTKDAGLRAQAISWTFQGSVGSDPRLRMKVMTELIDALLQGM